MFLSRNKKNNVYPCKPQFYYIKVGFKGVKLYRHVFVMYCTEGYMYILHTRYLVNAVRVCTIYNDINCFLRVIAMAISDVVTMFTAKTVWQMAYTRGNDR